MTAVLMCDGCGRVASSSDPTDGDPARSWWELSQGPVPGGGMLALPALPILDAEPVELEVPDMEPVRHFCSTACLRDWLGKRP